jgi:hypothetical protein
MDLARFLGEVGADIFGMFLDVFAQAGRELAHLLGVAALDAPFLGAADGRRHDGFFDANGIAGRATQLAAFRLLSNAQLSRNQPSNSCPLWQRSE